MSNKSSYITVGECRFACAQFNAPAHSRSCTETRGFIMTIDENKRLRLNFLTRVVHKETHYLAETDQRLFNNKPLTMENINRMESDPELAERVDAFVSRFGRFKTISTA